MTSKVLAVPGWTRYVFEGGRVRHDSPDGSRSVGLVVPCIGRGLRGRILSLFSCYDLASGVGFDVEGHSMFDSLSTLSGALPVIHVRLGLGGDTNTEVGFRRVGV